MQQDKAPVLQGGITASALILLFKAILNLGRASGWWVFSDEVYGAVVAVGDAAFPVLVTLATMWWTMRRTTSLSHARDIDGEKLVREDTKVSPLMEYRSINREELKKLRKE